MTLLDTVNTLEHFGTWFVPSLITLLIGALITVIAVVFNDLKATLTKMQEQLGKVFNVVNALKLGKAVQDEKILEICKDVTQLKTDVKRVDKRIDNLEKDHLVFHKVLIKPRNDGG
jgi:peptidoglycan hydrolase CwlO-like protein